MLEKAKSECCGCAACSNICPQNAITMKPDEEGFEYPVIDENLCIQCGLCEKICTLQLADNHVQPQCYAAKHKNVDILAKSSSGGVFSALSDAVLSLNGFVVGASYDYKNHELKHILVGSTDERDNMRGSKYLQSSIGNVYEQIKIKLKNDAEVLFIGTPCQCAGLKSYLAISNIATTKLFTIDLVCHGVPSPKVWKEYVIYLEKKNKTSFDFITFKDKRVGWLHPKAYAYSGKTEYSLEKLRRVLFGDVALRPSCHECQYAALERVGDITIGDFWSIQRVSPEFYDDRGVSVVLVNTGKGNQLLDRAADELLLEEHSTWECRQRNMYASTQMSRLRERFWKDYLKKGPAVVSKWDGIFKVQLAAQKIKAKVVRK